MLGQQKYIFNKKRLGYNINSNRKYFKIYFTKASNDSRSSINNNCSGKYGHLSHAFARTASRKKNNWKTNNLKANRPTQIWLLKS